MPQQSSLDPSEPVIRILCSPYHIGKDGRLNRNAFKDKQNDLSLVRLAIAGKDGCISQGERIGNNSSDPNKCFAGICLLCPQKTEETVRQGDFHVKVEATPNPHNPAHASLLVLQGGKVISTKEYEPLLTNQKLGPLLGLMVSEINLQTIGQQYTIAKFENTPEEALLNRCGDI